MPITQSRMLAILNAYSAILTHYAGAKTLFNTASEGIKSDGGKFGLARTSAATGDYESALKLMNQAYDDLESIANELFSGASDILLSANYVMQHEQAHFAMRRKYNDYKRIYQRDKRDSERESGEHQHHLQRFQNSESGVPGGPTNSPDDDGIPEIPENYTREDYDRERAARKLLDQQRRPTTIEVKS